MKILTDTQGKVLMVDGNAYNAKIFEPSKIEWHQCPQAVKNYLEQVTYDPSDYSTSRIAEFAPATPISSNTKPIGKTVDGITYYNEVPNVETLFSSENAAGTLKPLDSLRWINTATINVRDLGGWSCDGGTVKYGMLFRGGEPSASDKSLMVDKIGIKHELQLRGTGEEPQPYSLWGVAFSHTTNFVWLSVGEYTKPTWKEILDCVFSTVNKNIPLYFHCAAGADRTGTVAVMLEALLGMSQSDIDKDYELTCFYTGTGSDQSARRRNEDEYKDYISSLKSVPLVGGLTDSFRNRAISFILPLGYTIDEINAFRAAMIDGYDPAEDDITIGTYTIDKSEVSDKITIDNPATSVTQYSHYTAKLTPAAGYAIDGDSVKVTIGGELKTTKVFKGTETNLYRQVTQTLTHCTSNNAKIAVIYGQDFTCELTPDNGYTLDEEAGASVVITVDGRQVYPEPHFIPIEIYDPSKAQINVKWSGTSEVAGDGYFLTHIVDVDTSQTPYLHVVGAKYGEAGAPKIYKIGKYNESDVIQAVDYETNFTDTHTDIFDTDFYVDLRTSSVIGIPTRICVSMHWRDSALTAPPASSELSLTLCEEIPS